MGATTQTEVSIGGVITEIEIIEETWNTENNVLHETIEEMTDAEMVNIDFKLVLFDFLKNHYKYIIVSSLSLKNYWFLNCNQIDRDHSRDRSHRSERGGYRSDGPFTIKMGGLPYKATVNEIIDWFHPRANCIDVRIFRGRDNR